MEQLILLVAVFFKIGLFSIGGGYAIIPLIQSQVVEQYRWISEKTFTDIITISQMTPGPLAVNTSTFIGIQIAGIPGAVLATTGCVISGILISVFLFCFFKKHKESNYILEVLGGLRASSLGLIISAAGSILLLAFTGSNTIQAESNIDPAAILIFISSLVILRKWKMNPILIMAAAGIVGGIIY